MDGTVAILVDLDGEVSVTNDAENVVHHICSRERDVTRILYKDTEGQWDELKFRRDRAKIPEFVGFVPISGEDFVKFGLHER